MSIPSDRRTLDSIVNNLLSRVRVLEALPAGSAGNVDWAEMHGGPTSVPSGGAPTILGIYGTGHNTNTDLFELPTFADPYAIEVKAPGFYVARVRCLFQTAPTYFHQALGVAGTTNPPTYSTDYDGEIISDLADTGGYTYYWQAYYDMYSLLTFPQFVGASAEQTSGGSVNCYGSVYMARLGDASA
jgi:hypothetical protein